MPWGRSFKRPLENRLAEAMVDSAVAHRNLDRIPVWLANTKEWQPEYIDAQKYARENRN